MEPMAWPPRPLSPPPEAKALMANPTAMPSHRATSWIWTLAILWHNPHRRQEPQPPRPRRIWTLGGCQQQQQPPRPLNNSKLSLKWILGEEPQLRRLPRRVLLMILGHLSKSLRGRHLFLTLEDLLLLIRQVIERKSGSGPKVKNIFPIFTDTLNDPWSPIPTQDSSKVLKNDAWGQPSASEVGNSDLSIDPFSPVAQKELTEFDLLRNEIEAGKATNNGGN